MAGILECFIEKAKNRVVTAKSVQTLQKKLEQMSQEGTVGSEYMVAKSFLDESKILLDNRLTNVIKHTDLVEKYINVLDAAMEKGVPAKVALRAISIGDEAHNFKYGHIITSAREVVEAYQNHFSAKATEAFTNLMPKGFFKWDRSPDFDRDVVKGLFNILKGVDDPALSKAAKATAKVIDDLHNYGGKLFQKSGGNIRLMEGHALGDTADVAKITKLGADDWIKLARTSYDREFFASSLGMVSVTDELWNRALKDAYNSKVSGGLSRLGDWVPQGLRSTINSRSHHRLFRFKDAESYITYHEQLGGIDLYSATKQYAESIGRDIGILEALGPKPQALENALLRHVGAGDPETLKALQSKFSRDLRYVTKSYANSTNASMDTWLGTAGSLRVSGSLATTSIDAGTVEKVFSKISGHIRGLPILQTIREDLRATFATGAKKKAIYKDLAEQALHLEAYIDESANTLRSHMSDGGHSLARKFAQAVLKVTGLIDITNGTRAGSVRSLSMEIGERSWGEVSSNFKRYFQNLGLDEEMFNTIKQYGSSPMVGMENINGVSVEKLFESGKVEEAIKLSSLVNRITEAAAPTRSHRWVAALEDLSRSGNPVVQFLGENFKLFTGYPTSFWDNHIRVLANMPGAGKKMSYAGAYIVVIGTIGTIPVMIKDMLAGKEPTLNTDTVLRSFSRSGLVPIISDFLLAPSEGNNGADLAKRLLGVHGSTAVEVGAGLKDIIWDTAEGKGPDTGIYRIQRALKGMMPGQNIPLIGLAMNRMLLDQLRYFYDPDAAKKFRKMARNAQDDGTPYIWKPGDFLPK